MDNISDFYSNFNKNDQKIIINYFNDLKDIKYSKKDKIQVINDFMKYILFCYDMKMKVSNILKLIPIEVFKKDESKWYSLDTSSKIYPLSMNEEWMSVFRLSLYLNDDINEIVLQMALNYTIRRFPLFSTSIHKGFFWNYLDYQNIRIKVYKEDNIPCSRLNISKVNKSAFRVIYYKNRISCEYFHLICDAHGGMIFLTSLVNEYLRLLGKKVNYNEYAWNTLLKSSNFENEDAFLKTSIDKNIKKISLIDKRALQIDGRLSSIKPCQVIHFDIDLDKIHVIAHKKNVTINQLILSYLFMVIGICTSKNGNIKIQVPVDMRKYYKINTIRNFSLYNTISINKKNLNNIDNILKEVRQQSNEKLSKEVMDGVMLNAKNLVHYLSFIPLFIKKPLANFIFKYFSDKSSTIVVSNLGNIILPNSMKSSVTSGDFVLGTNLSNRVLVSIITINKVLTLSISKFTTNKSFENNLYNLLKKENLIINIKGSEEYEYRK